MGAPATLILVRHAHTDCADNGHVLLCGRYDAPISTLGWQQVSALQQRLRAEDSFAAVYTSPLKRAAATASAGPPQLPRRLLRSLAEINCGRLDGLPLARVRAEYADIWRRNCAQNDPGFRWPGGESYAQFRRRVLRVMRQLGLKHPGGRILVFTHAGVVTQIVGSIVGQSPARWDRYRPGNASITELLFEDGHFDVIRFDDRDHLSGSIAHPLF